MSPRTAKSKKINWRTQPVKLSTAIGILALFSLSVGIYLIAGVKNALTPVVLMSQPPNSPAAGIYVPQIKPENQLKMKAFLSPDDFKSYLDDGKRAFGDGIYETQILALSNTVGTTNNTDAAKTATQKSAARNQKDNQTIDADDGAKYMSLGKTPNGGDIFNVLGKNIFFSPENQYYSATSREAGQTLIFEAGDSPSLAQIGLLPSSGSQVIGSDVLAVISGNSLFIYDVSNPFISSLLWKARVSDDSQIISLKITDSKLYLALKTKIDAANPCPIKPLAIGDKPLIIECGAILHSETPILADSIYSAVEIEIKSPGALRHLSFIGAQDNSALLIVDDAIYAAWGQGSDYVSFFVGFLAAKCRGLLPNYILGKAQELPNCGISLAAKELELRSLLSNWFLSLSSQEQIRVAGQISERLNDYLRDHYCDFEQADIAIADLATFKFAYQNQVAGRLVSPEFLDPSGNSLRVVAVSGSGATKKMTWLITGKIDDQNQEKVVASVYILDSKMEITSARQNLDLPSGVCALRYTQNAALAATCCQSDPIYAIGLGNDSTGALGKLDIATFPSYLYPFTDGLALVVSKNNRKIKLTLFDATIPAKVEKISEYDLNDYWADFDASYPAFANDDENKLFFLPSLRGGYLFSRQDGKIELKKTVGDVFTSRAVFDNGYLYIAGDNGIEIFTGPDWAKIKSVKF